MLQTKPVLLHFEHVNLPKTPEARPPLQAWQSCSGRWHFVHFMSAPIRVQTLRSASCRLDDQVSSTTTHETRPIGLKSWGCDPRPARSPDRFHSLEARGDTSGHREVAWGARVGLAVPLITTADVSH